MKKSPVPVCGMGDAFIIMVTGLYLGFMDTLILLWISSVLAAVFGIITIRIYDNKEKELPFVPFLLIGFIIQYSLKGIL